MWVKVVDGTAVFATHFILARVPRESRDKLGAFQVEKDGVVVYPDQNVLDAEQMLQELKIPYTVEELRRNQALITKAAGIKYTSRTEAIEHLLNNKTPKNVQLPSLMGRLEKVEKDLSDARKELAITRSRLACVEGIQLQKRIGQ